MSNTDVLPPLPDPLVMINRYGLGSSTSDGDGGVFTADQMRAYARAALAQQPAASEPAEHVAEIGPVWSLVWASAEPLAHVLARHPSVRIGSKLYAAPQPAPALVPLTDEAVLELRSRHGWAKETIRAIEAELMAAHGITAAPKADKE